MARTLRPGRLVAIVSGMLTLYSFCRVANLFFEALSTVRTARAEDEQLLVLCSAGHASGSGKMRDACLKARAERASPIVFKAIVQAVGTAFKDFTDTVGSPFKLGVVVLFMISSITLPIIPWARFLLGQQVTDEDGPGNGVHYIGYAPPADRRGGFRRRVGSAMRRLKLRRHPSIQELDDCDMEPGRTIVDVKPRTSPSGDGDVAIAHTGWDDISLTRFDHLHSKWE